MKNLKIIPQTKTRYQKIVQNRRFDGRFINIDIGFYELRNLRTKVFGPLRVRKKRCTLYTVIPAKAYIVFYSCIFRFSSRRQYTNVLYHFCRLFSTTLKIRSSMVQYRRTVQIKSKIDIYSFKGIKLIFVLEEACLEHVTFSAYDKYEKIKIKCT